MPDAEQIGPSSFESGRPDSPRTPRSSAPRTPRSSGSGQPDSPPRKRRKLRKFAIRRKSRLPRLPPDVWNCLLGHISSKPSSLLLSMMTCKTLLELIRDHHETWRLVYSRWEGGYASVNPRSTVYVRPVPNALGYMRLGLQSPRGPVSGQPNVANFKNFPILNSDKPNFHSFVRKLVAMAFMNRCSMCGSRRRIARPYWSLGLRLCPSCLRSNLISNRVLGIRYGMGLLDRYNGIQLSELVRHRVFYFRCMASPSDRTAYTLDPLDYGCKNVETIFFFWVPHLRKLGTGGDFLEELWKRKLARDTAARVLSGVIRAKHVRLVHQEFDGRPRRDKACRVKKLYRNEIKRVDAERARVETHYIDCIFYWRNTTHLDAMFKHADYLPEPWDAQLEPVRAPDVRPDDPFVEN